MIVGAGTWGQKIINALITELGVTTISIVHRNQNEHAKLRALYPAAMIRSSLKEIDGPIDLAIVATQVSSQFEILGQLAARRINTLVEKPFCSSFDEADTIAQAFRRNQTCLHVDNIYLHSDTFHSFAECFTEGFQDRPFIYTSRRWDFGSFPKDSNTLNHLLYHDLTMLDHLLGLEALQVQGYRAIGDYYADLTLSDGLGSLFELSASQISATKVRMTTVSSSHACLEWNDLLVADPVRITKLDIAGRSQYPTDVTLKRKSLSTLGAVLKSALWPDPALNYRSVDVALKVKRVIENVMHGS